MTEEPSPGAPAAPRISVIITAHDRREFLLEAVASVLGSAGPAPFEIWVVKSFHDPALDAELEARGVRHVETEAAPLGAKLALGIGRSSGEILTFLEDDDAYEPGRLARVAERFGRDPGLGYYRNGQRRVGPTGSTLSAGTAGRAEENLRRFGTVAGGTHDLPRMLPRLVRIDPDFNLSSIAVRREALADRIQELAALSAAVDSFVFYAALEHRLGLCIEAEPLTRYRVHPSNVSLWQGADGSSLEARAGYQRRFLLAFEGIYARLRARGPASATRLAASAYFGTWILYRLLTGEGGRSAMARDLGRYWRRSPGSALRYRWDLSVWGLAALVSPGIARRRFLRRRDLESHGRAGPGASGEPAD